MEGLGKGKGRKAKVKRNLNVRHLAYQSIRPDDDGAKSDTSDTPEDGPDEIRCDCDQPGCRGFIRI